MTEQEYIEILKRIDRLSDKARKGKLSQNEADELKVLLEQAEDYEANADFSS